MAAQIKATTKKKQLRNSSCFLGCFGFPSEDSNQIKLSSDDHKTPVKRRKWFSWARKYRSTHRKVLAADATPSPAVKAGKRVVSDEIQMWKPDKKLSTVQPHPVNQVEVGQVSAPVTDQVKQKANKTKHDNAPEIILKKRKSTSKSDAINSTSQEELTTVGKSTARRTISRPVSPDDKSKTSRSTTKVLSHSLSLPPPKSKKSVVNGFVGQQTTTENKSTGKSDSMVGMSVLLITLMIMLFWGKVCAIVCTSAWFYFVPRLTTKNNKQNVTTTNDSNVSELQLDTEEYKKKVILEGLLQRKHRNGFVI